MLWRVRPSVENPDEKSWGLNPSLYASLGPAAFCSFGREQPCVCGIWEQDSGSGVEKVASMRVINLDGDQCM